MKKILSMCLCCVMLMSSLIFMPSAKAYDDASDLRISTAENNVPVDLDSVEGSLTDMPPALAVNAAAVDAAKKSEPLSPSFNNLPLSTELHDADNKTPINLRTRSANTDFHFSGTIAEPNGMFTIYPITLYSTQNIHAELVGPSNDALNYDLRLYEMDTSTGTLTSLVDICAYTNRASSTALPQTVATINRTTSAKTYALIVYALTGSSATDAFDVNITLGSGGDPGESNDNAFTAYALDVLSINGFHVQGTTLDSAKDVDWFYFSVPQQNDYTKIKITNSVNSEVKYQLFYVSGGTTLVELKETNGFFPVRTGALYLRVTDNGNDFANGDIIYEPTITVSFAPTKLVNQFRMNEYADLPTQTYKVWSSDETEYHPEKRIALLGSCRLEWKATFYSASGYLCTDATNTLHLYMTNYSWVPTQFQTLSAESAPAVNGVATVVVDPALGCRGVYSGVSGMSYDTDCSLNMWADGFPSITSGDMPIFFTSRIMT